MRGALGWATVESVEANLPDSGMTASCDHPEIYRLAESADDGADYLTAPYGRILQHGTCHACGARVERSLRGSG
jgi:hypothetical protein